MNFDSLVDVVTNTNGMLVLLAIFTTMIGLGKAYRVVDFPIERNTDASAVWFECRKNRVLKLGNEHYHILSYAGRLLFEVKSEGRGTEINELDLKSSDFFKSMKDIDTEKQYAAFLVRGDSFEAFVAAREVMHKHKIPVGWQPVAEDDLIALVDSGSGRKVKPQ